MIRTIRLLAFAWALALASTCLLPISATIANPVTPQRQLLCDTTTDPGALVISGQGYEHLVLQFDAPGGGKSYAYSLTSRICVSTSSCSEWASTPLASGTISGTGDLEIVLTQPRDQYRLTLSSITSAPTMRIWLLRI